MINSEQHAVQNSGPWDLWQALDQKHKIPGVPAGAVGCRIQDLGTCGYRWWWKTADFSYSAGTAHGAPPTPALLHCIPLCRTVEIRVAVKEGRGRCLLSYSPSGWLFPAMYLLLLLLLYCSHAMAARHGTARHGNHSTGDDKAYSKWVKINTKGRGPSARKYHTAVMVETTMVVFGGSNGHQESNELWCAISLCCH